MCAQVKHWTMVDGARLVSQWDQVLGERPDGSPAVVAGLSILYYAGEGHFCYSHDMLNMTHVGETMRDMEWRPPAEFNMPPRQPNRDVSLPEAWAHLEPSRAPQPQDAHEDGHEAAADDATDAAAAAAASWSSGRRVRASLFLYLTHRPSLSSVHAGVLGPRPRPFRGV